MNMYEAEVYDWKPSTQTQTDADTDTGTDTDTDTDTDTHTHTWLLSDVTLSRHPRKFGYGIGKWIAEGQRARQRQGPHPPFVLYRIEELNLALGVNLGAAASSSVRQHTHA